MKTSFNETTVLTLEELQSHDVPSHERFWGLSELAREQLTYQVLVEREGNKRAQEAYSDYLRTAEEQQKVSQFLQSQDITSHVAMGILLTYIAPLVPKHSSIHAAMDGFVLRVLHTASGKQFEGSFTIAELIKAGFHPKCSWKTHMISIRDALQPSIETAMSYEYVFLTDACSIATQEIKSKRLQQFQDGCALQLTITELYKGETMKYPLTLRCISEETNAAAPNYWTTIASPIFPVSKTPTPLSPTRMPTVGKDTRMSAASMAEIRKALTNSGGFGLGKKRLKPWAKRGAEHLGKNDIKRLARRAGVIRFATSNSNVYDEIRSAAQMFLEGVLFDAVGYCLYAKRKTLTADDVVHALRRRRVTLYGFSKFD